LYKKSLDPILIAAVCHQVNKAYCEALGDYSQVNFPDAPENIRQSAIMGVIAALSNPNQTPEMSHEGWLQFKTNDGWVYGPVKDMDKKTHPCMVPYDQLPEAQRKKDSLFLNTVRTMERVINGE
jgi:hypothetical protein